MNVLLTGATGFLGSHLANALLRRGDSVSAYRRRASQMQRLGDAANRMVWFDLDASELARPFERNGGFDAVIHAATCYGRAAESLSTVVETNVVFPVAIFEHARAHNVGTFLNVHTSLPRHLNAYALGKHQLIDWTAMAEGPTKAVHLAFEHFYGPGDDTSKFIGFLLSQMLAGTARIPLTAGDQIRDFLFIDDAVAACLHCLDRAAEFAAGEIVPIGSGKPVSIRDLAETCRSVSGTATTLDFGAIPYRKGEVMISTLDFERLQGLGWKPLVSLREGLEAVVRHLRTSVETAGAI